MWDIQELVEELRACDPRVLEMAGPKVRHATKIPMAGGVRCTPHFE